MKKMIILLQKKINSKHYQKIKKKKSKDQKFNTKIPQNNLKIS